MIFWPLAGNVIQFLDVSC